MARNSSECRFIRQRYLGAGGQAGIRKNREGALGPPGRKRSYVETHVSDFIVLSDFVFPPSAGCESSSSHRYP